MELFYAQGTPTGIVTAEIPGWTGRLTRIPRAHLAQFEQRPEYEQQGIALLLGDGSSTSDSTPWCLLERSDHFGAGLAYRAAETANWDQAILISTSQRFTDPHWHKLERLLTERAQQAGKANLVVAQELHGQARKEAPRVRLSEAQKAVVRDFMNNVALTLPALGVHCAPYDPVKQESLEPLPEEKPAAQKPAAAKPAMKKATEKPAAKKKTAENQGKKNEAQPKKTEPAVHEEPVSTQPADSLWSMKLEPNPAQVAPVFTLRDSSAQVQAKMQPVMSGFIVLEGSRIAPDWNAKQSKQQVSPRSEAVLARRRQILVDDGFIRTNQDQGIVVRDLTLNSLLTATSIAVGHAEPDTSGWTNRAGQTYDEWKEQHQFF